MPLPHEVLQAALGEELFQLGTAATGELYFHWQGPDDAIEEYFTEGIAHVIARVLNAGPETDLRPVSRALVSAMVLAPEHVAKLRSFYGAGHAREPWMSAVMVPGGMTLRDATTEWSRDWNARHAN